MERKTKYCPFCGEEININAKKCKCCKSWLNKSEEMPEEQEYYENQNDYNQNNNFWNFAGCLTVVILIFLGLALGILFGGSENTNETTNNNKNDTIKFFKELLFGEELACDSNSVQNLVVKIFKENNPYYLSNINSVSDVFLEYPVATAYDEMLDKYSCKGTVIVKNSQTNQDYQCNITYTAQTVKDGVYVETTACTYQEVLLNLLRHL